MVLKYFWLTLRHKWFVFVAGRRLAVPLWRLLIHDWTKLLPSNARAYGRQFYGAADRPLEFSLCWLRHQNAHDHHWEWWVPRTGHNRAITPYPDNEPLSMSIDAAKEMVADWLAASRAYEGHWPADRSSWSWYKNNFDKIRVHPDTRQVLVIALDKWFR